MMKSSRRKFLKIGLGTAAATGVTAIAAQTNANDKSTSAGVRDDHVGCLVDTTLCIGCRQCEKACNEANHLPMPKIPFDDQFVLVNQRRRPIAEAFTVVNGWSGAPSDVQYNERNLTYVKVQCMHCLDPACASACIVGALKKDKDGPVVYDANKCIGCRYCMVACPFEIPAYEYTDPITPRVRKCTLCVDESSGKDANPACAATCPAEAIVFGKRNQLVELAKTRIKSNPRRYLDHIYGLHEVGGTTWLYLAGREFAEIGLHPLPKDAPPRLTEAIQHGIFKYGAAPVLLYGGLAALMYLNGRKNKDEIDEEGRTRPPEEPTSTPAKSTEGEEASDE